MVNEYVCPYCLTIFSNLEDCCPSCHAKKVEIPEYLFQVPVLVKLLERKKKAANSFSLSISTNTVCDLGHKNLPEDIYCRKCQLPIRIADDRCAGIRVNGETFKKSINETFFLCFVGWFVCLLLATWGSAYYSDTQKIFFLSGGAFILSSGIIVCFRLTFAWLTTGLLAVGYALMLLKYPGLLYKFMNFKYDYEAFIRTTHNLAVICGILGIIILSIAFLLFPWQTTKAFLIERHKKKVEYIDNLVQVIINDALEKGESK